jgi:hypothetical protein
VFIVITLNQHLLKKKGSGRKFLFPLIFPILASENLAAILTSDE